MADKIALVLEGGGSRGMFTAGILDSFLINNITFDAVYGVSAGALYGASFVSRQIGRNVKLNKYIGDKRYGGFMHLLRSGSYFSWDFIFGELAHEILPYDYKTLRNSTDFYVGVSNCNTGMPEFFRTNELEKTDYIELLTASASLPFISPAVPYKGEEYLDGGMTDSIPYEIALEQGADKVVVVLTRPEGYVKSEMKFQQICKWYYQKYPMVYKALRDRARHYNASIQKLKELEKNGQAYVIYPNKELAVSRVERDSNKTEAIYHEAMNDSKVIIPTLEKWRRNDD
ncbi:MAG: patatin family protein [Bacteroidota bacterium]